MKHVFAKKISYLVIIILSVFLFILFSLWKDFVSFSSKNLQITEEVCESRGGNLSDSMRADPAICLPCVEVHQNLITEQDNYCEECKVCEACSSQLSGESYSSYLQGLSASCKNHLIYCIDPSALSAEEEQIWQIKTIDERSESCDIWKKSCIADESKFSFETYKNKTCPLCETCNCCKEKNRSSLFTDTDIRLNNSCMEKCPIDACPANYNDLGQIENNQTMKHCCVPTFKL